ncbi:hypothetical protein B0A49_05551 [Cryomyces minteri]|uniref:HAUS augmin-like complex subunit 3 N-terminal domain-containing protein n=1 Tax=Cryomyces minteri TaxID=331657 RepID=A0A4U0X0X1_9PEZI|nr:hypothetical protein B0A49_05551 [Cryomyces minteri]
MILPLDTTLGSRNPLFAGMYQDLVARKLDPDGATKRRGLAAHHALAPLRAPETAAALRAYTAHLQTLQTALRQRETAATTRLKAYDETGGERMREIARVFTEVGAEIERAREAVARARV